nr:translation initiation factor IF-2-like [Manis javanica]
MHQALGWNLETGDKPKLLPPPPALRPERPPWHPGQASPHPRHAAPCSHGSERAAPTFPDCGRPGCARGHRDPNKAAAGPGRGPPPPAQRPSGALVSRSRPLHSGWAGAPSRSPLRAPGLTHLRLRLRDHPGGAPAAGPPRKAKSSRGTRAAPASGACREAAGPSQGIKIKSPERPNPRGAAGGGAAGPGFQIPRCQAPPSPPGPQTGRGLGPGRPGQLGGSHPAPQQAALAPPPGSGPGRQKAGRRRVPATPLNPHPGWPSSGGGGAPIDSPV